MSTTQYFALLARYNADMNQKLYDAAAKLPPGELRPTARPSSAPCSAPSTTCWRATPSGSSDSARIRPATRRCRTRVAAATHRPHALLRRHAAALRAYREQLDAMICAWSPQLTEADLAGVFEYRNMKGEPFRKHFGGVLQHFFNHQTHHRGQASTC
jgi:uncharacterized damage-inducible protein DinB